MRNRSAGRGSFQLSNLHRCYAALLFFCSVSCFLPSGFADTLIWNGGGTTANWSDSGNWFGVVPANGDTLVFQGGQPKPFNTNNIVGLTLNQIRFIGASGGYTIVGNSFGLSNAISSIEATNTAGINTISNDIVVPSPNLVVNVAPGAKLVLSGVLSGSGGLVKNGGGTNLLAGRFSNSYAGTTTVSNGVMEVQKNGITFTATAIPGNLVIGNGLNSTTFRSLEPEDVADSAAVTINGLAAWDLTSWTETIGASLTLNGGSVVGSGTLILSPNNTITVNNGSSVSANLNVGSGTCTIQANSGLTVSGVISGSADITKNGGGSMLFDNQNTFTGSFTANGFGYVWITHPLGLGTTAGGSTFNGSTSLAIDGNITVTNEALALNTTSTLGIQNFAADTNTWTGPVTLGTNSTIWVVTNGSFIITGALSGPGGFTKTGPGLLTLAGPSNSSSYLGDTTVNDGILLLNSVNVIRHGTLTIGDGVCYSTTTVQQSDVVRYLTGGCIFGGLPGGSKVIVKSTGLLDLNGFFDDVGPIEMDGGRITTGGGGTLELFEPFVTYRTDPTNGVCNFIGNLLIEEDSTLGITNDLTINGVISSTGNWALTKNGVRNLYLSGANTYTGPTIIQQGWLHAQTATALGQTNFGTVVSNNASLVLDNSSFGITNEALTLNGAGASFDWGALDIETFGTNIWAGPITVNVDSTITAYGSGSVLRIIGPINGAGGVTTLADGTGTIYFEGGAGTANTYGGVTRVYGGSLLLDKNLFDASIPHDLVIGDGFGGVNADVVRNLVANQIPNNANVTIASSGLLDLSTGFDGLGTITGTGNLALGNQFLDMYGTTTYTFDGVISGTGFFRQLAAGTAILTGNNTYTGATIVNSAGAIYVNGSQPQSSVQVSSSSGSFGGSGVVGDILCSGHLRPGNSPGILTCSNLTLTASATFHEEISGRVPGTGYDQMNVRGTNNLANALLAITVPLVNGVSVGDQIVMINNDGVDPITGTFAGYSSGSSFIANGFTYVISYTGNTGNDVVFTVTTIPGDVLSSSVSAGNGDHIIGPNECNNFSVVITNKTVTPMTGVTAVLSTTTAGVEITQPYSSYPNVPALGGATNVAPFQISTLPSFACGNDINLQLTVHPASHGAFTVPFVVHTGSPGNVPVRVDNSTITNIPDVGTIESTNVVTTFSGLLSKVAVSIWLTHPFDSDLSISLISPNGTTVNLTSGNGAGANFGSGCSPDANRTTFDDSGLVSITAGSPPYVGTFRPQAPLSGFFETPIVTGSWRLRVTDSVGGSLGALRCWSLFLYPITCAPGSGLCALCSPPITGSITNTDLVEPTRVSRNSVVASCGTLKAFPGTLDSNLHYKTHTFLNNSGADACVTVELAASCDVQAIGYLGSFDTNNLASNYLGDSGLSTSSGTPSFSCNVPAGATLVVVVNEINSGTGCNNYTLTLSGIPCPAPALSVEDLPGPNAHIFWPNSAGGYILESSPLVQPTTWSPVTNEPIINGGNYNVTNTTTAPSQFYRLHKP
jgi:autotransporter-associated beta strand protein